MSAVESVKGAISGKRAPLIIAGLGGLVVFLWWQGRAPVPAVEDDQLGSGDITRVPAGSASGSTGTPDSFPEQNPRTNAEWEIRAINWLVGKAYDGALAQRAIGNALSGQPLSLTEQAAVALVIAVIGPPPQGMPPLQGVPGPSPTPTPTPTPTPKFGPRGTVLVRTNSGKTWAGAVKSATNWDALARSAYRVPTGWKDYERLRSALANANKMPRAVKGYRFPGFRYNIPAGTVVYYPSTLKI